MSSLEEPFGLFDFLSKKHRLFLSTDCYLSNQKTLNLRHYSLIKLLRLAVKVLNKLLLFFNLLAKGLTPPTALTNKLGSDLQTFPPIHPC